MLSMHSNGERARINCRLVVDSLSFYKEDFDQDILRTQLQTFAVHFQQVHEGSSDSTTKYVNIFDVKSYLLSLSPCSAITHIESETPDAAHISYACHKCIFRTIFQCFEAGENLSSCNHEAGSSKLPDASSCAQRQNR